MYNIRLISLFCVLLGVFSAWPAHAALTFYWRAEGTTLDATDDENVNNPTETAGSYGTPAINSSAGMVGTNGIDISTIGEGYTFQSTATNLTVASGAIGFYFRYSTADPSIVLRLFSNSGSSNDYIRVRLLTSGGNHLQFQIKESGGPSEVSLDCTGVLSSSTVYFVIFKWDQSASDRRCEIYNASGTLVDSAEDLTTGWTSPATSYPVTAGLDFGEGGAGFPAYHLDNIFLATTWDDAATIYCNRNITSHSSYAACSAGAVIFWGD